MTIDRIKKEIQELAERNRGVYITGLNQAVFVQSDYSQDTLKQLTNYALNIYQTLIHIEKEENK